MSRKRGAMLAISGLCALLTATIIYRALSRGDTVEANVRDTSTLVIAKSNLTRGLALKPEHLEQVSRPTDELPAGSFSQARPLVGRIVKRPVAAGKPILQDSLAATKSIFEARLQPGYRAVGVFVDARGGLQRYLQAGDRVDVVVTMDNKDAGSSSRLILQDVEILEIPRKEGSAEHQTAAWMPVVLAVTPWDGEKLSLAMNVGTIQLLGRGSEDTQITATSGVTRDTLVAGGPMTIEQGAAGPHGTTYRSVELIKGDSRSEERFSMGPGGSWVERRSPSGSAPAGD
jgi:pilus assembly protein CpaB